MKDKIAFVHSFRTRFWRCGIPKTEADEEFEKVFGMSESELLLKIRLFLYQNGLSWCDYNITWALRRKCAGHYKSWDDLHYTKFQLVRMKYQKPINWDLLLNGYE